MAFNVSASPPSTCCCCSCSIRISAISCWCALSAAPAGLAAHRTTNPNAATDGHALGVIRLPLALAVPRQNPEPEPGTRTRNPEPEPARHHEVRAPILGPGSLLVAGFERKFLSVADGPQPVGGNPER